MPIAARDGSTSPAIRREDAYRSRGAEVAEHRAMRRVLLPALLLLAIAAAGCAADGEQEEEEEALSEDALVAGYTSIGNGVAYKKVTGGGDAVFIGYGGYSVQLDWSCKWSDALLAAKLSQLGVGHIYAVKGPNQPGYGAREIANTKLGAHLLAGPAANAPFVLVAAHSSGAYVAHELLDQLDDRGASTEPLRSKIVYANLDGGGGGLTTAIAGSLRHVAFVWAQDPVKGKSTNHGTMIALGNAYGSPAIRIDVAQSGCNAGAKWCLHDLVITTRPHNPSTFDLQKDYTTFTGNGRAVQTQWIDALAAHLE
jgi:hypothetical protein